jgi:hypothetical protein
MQGWLGDIFFTIQSFEFRVWLTTESNKCFPIGLLQMSLKFTNEPPQGIRASLKRTYADVTQDTLDYSNHPSWPSLLYSVAFLHTVVQVSIIYCKFTYIVHNKVLYNVNIKVILFQTMFRFKISINFRNVVSLDH